GSLYVSICQHTRSNAVKYELNENIVANEPKSIVTPPVIRLAYHIKRPRPVLKKTRKEVLVRDDHTCQYCGKRGHDLTLDHVIPRHRGGQHTWENVVAACKGCNHKKGGRTIQESNMTLARSPFRPPSTPSYLFSSYIRAGERKWFKFLGVEDSAAAS